MTDDDSKNTPKRGAPKKAESLKRKKAQPLMLTEKEKIRYQKYCLKKNLTLSFFLRAAAEEYMKNHPD